jgi:hypothetical protein
MARVQNELAVRRIGLLHVADIAVLRGISVRGERVSFGDKREQRLIMTVFPETDIVGKATLVGHVGDESGFLCAFEPLLRELD